MWIFKKIWQNRVKAKKRGKFRILLLLIIIIIDNVILKSLIYFISLN